MTTSEQTTLSPSARPERTGAPGSLFGVPMVLDELPGYPEAFEQACRTWPDAIAAEDTTGTITYSELERRTAALARALVAAVPAGQPVAMLVDLGIEAVVAYVGILRSGRPVVVLDWMVPVPKLQLIMELSTAQAIVTDQANADLAGQVGAALLPISDLEKSADPTVELPALTQDDIALIVFTSGSTGTPKGVVWSHLPLVTEACDEGTSQGNGPGARVLMPFPLSFAAGVAQVALYLIRGATLLVTDPRKLGTTAFVGWALEKRASVLLATPSLVRGMLGVLGEGQLLEHAKLVGVGGEPVQSTDVLGMRKHLPADAVFLEVYGSSEAAIGTAFLPISGTDPVPEGVIPAGLPSPWRSFRVVDENGQEVPDGETGDLIVTAPWVSLGYWRDPERTAEKFTRREDGLWDLRMGDLALIDSDGLLRIKGRSEASVKIRGYLVDPTEIEAALLASGRVREVVVVTSTEAGVARLIAYFVPTVGSSAASVGSLRGFLLSKLPTWMVPAHFVSLQELPKTERGKVDRMGLPPVPARTVEAPETDIESRLAGIWAEVLNLDEVGRNEDFFELGGDSLDAEEMLARVHADLGVRLLASDFIQTTGLAAFSDRVAGKVPTVKPSSWPGIEVRLREGTGGHTLFAIAGGGATSLTFTSLAAKVDPSHTVLVLQQRGMERWAPAEWSLEGMVRRRIALIKKNQPTGKYVLVGHSLGAILALEIARRMAEQGEDVVALAIDPYLAAVAPGRQERREVAEILAGPRPEGTLQQLKWRALGVLRLPVVALTGLLPKRWTPKMLPLAQSVFAMQGYQAKPFTGRAYGYRSKDNEDPDGVWESLIPSVVIRDLPCTHLSILQSPYIEAVAADVEASFAN